MPFRLEPRSAATGYEYGTDEIDLDAEGRREEVRISYKR